MWVFKSTCPTWEGITLVVNSRARRPRVQVTADGQGMVGHAGVRLLADLAERSGLEGALGTALRSMRQRRRRHEPGSVLVDLAVTLADGGDCLSDLQVLRNQPGLFGEVASQTTAWRVVEAIDQSLLERIQRARARARARVWKWGAAPGRVTLNFDATLVGSYSEKAGAAPTYKQGFGFHPLLVHLDETREALAGRLRPGNAGANTAQDHVELLDEALAQLPLPTSAEDPERGLEVLVRADTAGATHGFVEAITGRGLEFSIGFDVTEPVRLAILELPKSAWVDAIQQDLEPREGTWVAELTACLDLSTWPAGTRAIGRREEPHPGAQFNLFDPDGYRHQVLITNSQDLDIAYLEARHRGHAGWRIASAGARHWAWRTSPSPSSPRTRSG